MPSCETLGLPSSRLFLHASCSSATSCAPMVRSGPAFKPALEAPFEPVLEPRLSALNHLRNTPNTSLSKLTQQGLVLLCVCAAQARLAPRGVLQQLLLGPHISGMPPCARSSPSLSGSASAAPSPNNPTKRSKSGLCAMHGMSATRRNHACRPRSAHARRGRHTPHARRGWCAPRVPYAAARRRRRLCRAGSSPSLAALAPRSVGGCQRTGRARAGAVCAAGDSR